MKFSFQLPSISGQPRIGRARWAVTVGILLVSAVFETSFFTKFDGFPFFGASPGLTLAALAAFAFYAGGKAGGIAGIFSGFLLDSLSGAVFPVSTVVYFLVGYVVGETNLSLPRRDFRAYAIPAGLILPVRASLTLVRSGIYAGRIPSLWAVLVASVLPEAIWTFAASALFYPVFRKVFGDGLS